LTGLIVSAPVTHPDVDGQEEGFCVKMVEGVLTILPHGTPSFFTPQGLGQLAHEGMGAQPPCSLQQVAQKEADVAEVYEDP
jgi:hypothetical protein